jgi:hypothetical protein
MIILLAHYMKLLLETWNRPWLIFLPMAFIPITKQEYITYSDQVK